MASRPPRKAKGGMNRSKGPPTGGRRGNRSKTMARFYRAVQGGIKSHQSNAPEKGKEAEGGKIKQREDKNEKNKHESAGPGEERELQSNEQLIRQKKGGGVPVTESVRKSLELHFKADFRRVRIHADEPAARICHDLGVRAFTWGDDIFFAKGAYAPETNSGLKLLVHELAHTLQPGASDRIRCFGEPSTMPQAQYFAAYTKHTQALLDIIYARKSYQGWVKANPDLVLKGSDFGDAAKAVYNEAKVKDYNRIPPPEIAVAQALLEGGMNPKKGSWQVANPMNVGIYTGAQKNKQAQNLDTIRKTQGDMAARKAGIKLYYSTLYDNYMAVYKRPEQMLQYDKFNKHGTTEYKNRFAEAFYYENKMAAQIGLLYMEKDKNTLKGSVGGTKGNDPADLKKVYEYIKSYDKYPGKRQPKVKYADLVKTDTKGVPTIESMHKALWEIQDKEIVPAESSFSKSKKERAEWMKNNAKADYSQQVTARNSGVDGSASPVGNTIGFLYYHHLLVTNGKIFGVLGQEPGIDAAKIWKDAGRDASRLGQQFAAGLPGNADTVLAVLNYLWLKSDNLAYYVTVNASIDQLKKCPFPLLNKMYKAMDGGWTTAGEYEAMGKIRVAKGEAVMDKYPKLRIEPTEKKKEEAKKLKPSQASAKEIYDAAGGDYNAIGKAVAPFFYTNSLMIPELLKYVYGINRDNLAYAITRNAPLSALAAADPTVIKLLYDNLDSGWTTRDEYEMMAKLKPYYPTGITTVTGNSPQEKWANTPLTGKDAGSKNSEYARLIMEAAKLGICDFTNEGDIKEFPSGKGGPYDTFEKIRDGKLIGNGEGGTSQFNPKTTEMPILPLIHTVLKGQVKQWVDGGKKGKITPIKLGSFMVWNSTDTKNNRYAGRMRTTNHGMKASAIDINFAGTNGGNLQFTDKTAVTYVINVLKSLPKGTYEIGLPLQGEFFRQADFSGGAASHSNRAKDGSRAWTKIINADLRNLISSMYDKGYQMKIMLDNANHLHLAIGAGGDDYKKE